MFVHVIDSDEFIERLSDADLASWSEQAFQNRINIRIDNNGHLSVWLVE